MPTIPLSRTNGRLKARAEAIERTAAVDPGAMSRASARANERTKGYFGGNLGDSVERRLSALGPGNFLGGAGGHVGEGAFGLGTTYQAQSYGGYFGAGQGFGAGERVGPWVGGGSQGFTYLRRFSSSSSWNHQVIAQCVMAFLNFGIVNRVVTIFADFATEGLEIQHPDESTRNIINAWMQKAKIKERVHNFFMTLFVTGQVFIHRRHATLSDTDVRRLRRYNTRVFADGTMYAEMKNHDAKIEAKVDPVASAIARDGNREEFLGEEPSEGDKSQTIPWGYSALNPLQMDLRGEKFRGQNHWVMLLSPQDLREFKAFMSAGGKNIAESGGTLPPEFKERLEKKLTVNKTPGKGYSAELELDEDELYVLQDNKFDWFDWAVPFIWPALEHIDFKRCLRAMELRACETVINSIFLFKLGNVKEGLPAEEEHFERLADMLQVPGNAMNIIWNEAIEAEVLTADVAKLFDPKKHESADRDILMALGIPAVLLGGTGGSFASSFVAVASVLERLESARELISNWLMTEIKALADALGFRRLPSIKWGRNSLRDQTQWLQLVIQLADRGVLSKDTLLNEFGISDFDIEVNKQREEQKNVEEDQPEVMPHMGPYVKDAMVETRQQQSNLDIEDEKKERDLEFQKEHVDEMAKIQEKMAPKPEPGAAPKPGGGSQSKTPKQNGRPAGTSTKSPGAAPKKQANPRGPKGASAEVFEEYEEMKAVGTQLLREVEDSLSQRFLRVKGYKNVKQAKKEEKASLEDLIYHVFSHMPAPPQEVNTDDYIVHLVQSGADANMKAEVLDAYQSKCTRYASRFGKEPTKDQRRQFMVSSWTQCSINQHPAVINTGE